MDVFGTLEALNQVSWKYQLDLHLIAETLEPVTTEPSSPTMNKFNSSWFPQLLPTDTFETAPRDLDVLFVPGGTGARAPNLGKLESFVKEMAEKVTWFMSVCTGAIIASNAGVLDGKRATTNKLA